MKKIEIVHNGTMKHRLTVTPTRITIKIREGANQEEENRIVRFLTNVANQEYMIKCTQSFRGHCSIPTNQTSSLRVQMLSDRDKVSHTYHEDKRDGTAHLVFVK